jgi:ferredoxin
MDLKPELHIVEGVAGMWHYHLSETGQNWQPTLCGNNRVMRTSLPLSKWGTVGHLKETYCKECEKKCPADAILNDRGLPPVVPEDK